MNGKNRLMQLPSVIGTRDNDQDSIDLLGIFGSLIDQKWLIGALTGAFGPRALPGDRLCWYLLFAV